jgi:hypothetical protein
MTESPLTAALAKFHKAVGTIHEKSKAQYGSYADLADVLGTISGPLADSGLAVTQTFIPTEGVTILRTTLRHAGGEVVDSDLPLILTEGRGNPLHSFGAACTYQRRYALLAILNLAAGVEDNDGEGATAPAAKPQTVKKPATPAQTSKPAATKQPSPEPAPAVEPPLASGERDEILAVLREMFKSNKTAFERFNSEYRAAFNVPETVKTSDHIQERKHGDFAQQFFASLPPA